MAELDVLREALKAKLGQLAPSESIADRIVTLVETESGLRYAFGCDWSAEEIVAAAGMDNEVVASSEEASAAVVAVGNVEISAIADGSAIVFGYGVVDPRSPAIVFDSMEELLEQLNAEGLRQRGNLQVLGQLFLQIASTIKNVKIEPTRKDLN